VVCEPKNLVILYSKNDEDRKGGGKKLNNQINPELKSVVPRYYECRVVDVTGLSEKQTTSMLGVKPFKKDPKCLGNKILRNKGNSYQPIGLPNPERPKSESAHLS
jgi:hypothetical protein